MAERYGRDWHHEGRGFTDRASDEVRSWFGDDDAERRRRMDARERERDYPGRGDYGWGAGRSGRDETAGRSTAYQGRTDYGSAESGYRRDPRDFEPLGYDEWSGNQTRQETRWRDEAPDEHRRPGETRGYYEDDHGHTFEFDHRGEQTYVGRGPKGYRRSDERIREDVCDRLADDPRVDASEIEVAVKDGEVTLTGSVNDRHAKRRSEDVASQISGVRDVQNLLRVTR